MNAVVWLELYCYKTKFIFPFTKIHLSGISCKPFVAHMYVLYL